MAYLEEIEKQLKLKIEEKRLEILQMEQIVREQKAHLAGLEEALEMLQNPSESVEYKQSHQRKIDPNSDEKILKPIFPEKVNLTDEGTMIIEQ